MIMQVLQFAGGVGLFLLGMKLMTDGLKVAAGNALRSILADWTSTVPRGIAAGVLITGLVQSSSAVIFATIGFVNAGLLSLAQAIGVIYGSNVGTTFTSWLVALVGFNVDLKLLALPAIGIGMGLRTFGKGARQQALGEALTGFGVFFLGIDALKSVFTDTGLSLPTGLLGDGTGWSVVLYATAGILLTIVMQSSSAALAVTLTAAAGGVIPLTAAAGVVIGANIGTTSTAALAAIGATANAKRAALAHVLFNVISGGVALASLPLLMRIVYLAESLFGLEQAPATSLAVLHTLVNVTGLLLVAPFTRTLVAFLERRFMRPERDEGKARYLDRNVLATPVLALDALNLELARIGQIARRAAKGAISAETVAGQRLAADSEAVQKLVEATAAFIREVQQGTLPKDLADAFPQALRVTQYDDDVCERAVELAALTASLNPVDDNALALAVAELKAAAAGILDTSDIRADGWTPAQYEQRMEEWQSHYQDVKAHLLRAGAEGRIGVRQMSGRLDELTIVRRILDQTLKSVRYQLTLKNLVVQHQQPQDKQDEKIKQ